MFDRSWKAIKKEARSRWNARRLLRELEDYRARFLAAGLKIPDDNDLRLLLAKKHPHITPKPKGRLSIIALYHHYNWENESLKPALEKFGQVRHYDWVEEFDHRQEKEWHRSVKTAMNIDLVRRISRWMKEERADVVFSYFSGEIVTPKAMNEIRTLGTPFVNLSLNDKEHFIGKIRQGHAMGMRDICRCFDLCLTSTEDALKKYCVEGALPLYLPEGANPEVHKPCSEEKTIDVSFVGQRYGNRPDIIQRLKDEGVHVETFGHGWPNGPLTTEEMVRIYSKSRINLGFGGVSGFGGVYCLKGRDFEIPMSGGLYLTEYHQELEKVYEIGNEIMTYRGFDDLIAQIRYLLSDPRKAEEIRMNGFARARNEHTWEMRFEKVFRLMGILHQQNTLP